MAEKTVPQILREAADLCERGWCQGEVRMMRNGVECFCFDGALMRASGDFNWVNSGSLYVAAVRAVRRAFDWTGYEFVGWNDEHGRTAGEVVAKLREAAALAEQELTHG